MSTRRRPLGVCVMKPCPEPPAFSFLGTRDDWATADRLTYPDGEWIRACVAHAPEAMQRFTELAHGPTAVHADPINGGTTFAITPGDDEDQAPTYQPVRSERDPFEPNRADRRRRSASATLNRTPIRSHRRRNRRTW
jgi:hypothetical protein